MAPRAPRPIRHHVRARLGGRARTLAALLAFTLPLALPSGAHASTVIGDADVHLDTFVATPTGSHELVINVALTQTQDDCQTPLDGQACLRYDISWDATPIEAGYGLIAPGDVQVSDSHITLATDTSSDPNFTVLVGRGGSLSIDWTALPGGSPVTAGGQTSTLSPASVQGTVLGYGLNGTQLQADMLLIALAPTATPTLAPTATPTDPPTLAPTSTTSAALLTVSNPTATPTTTPTAAPTNAPTAPPTTTPTSTATTTPTKTATRIGTGTTTPIGPSGLTATRKTLATVRPTARPNVLITVTLRSQRERRGHAVPTLSEHMTLLSHPRTRDLSIAVYLAVTPRRSVSGTLAMAWAVSLPTHPRHGITARRRALVVYRTTTRGRTDGHGRLWLTLHSVYLSSGHATGWLTIVMHGLPTTTVRITF